MTTLNYSIAPSDMAFHALTTSLYKDRLRAPVREILSNAIDIQRRTGNQTAIEIKLPTPLNAQFRIRDFGSGLSKQDMLRLYSSLFSSDKHLTRANEVGGFGVGAKSPFAYTDAFTVESFHNGARTIYSAFMDGNRAPQLLELFTQESNEPSGLAVSYPVVKSDEDTLRSIVRQEVSICGHPVECIGLSTPIVLLEKNPQFEKIGNVWLGFDNTLIAQKNDRDLNAYGRMGNVLYPIKRSSAYPADLKAAMTMWSLLTKERDRMAFFEDEDPKRLRWDTTIFDLPIGSVRPAMSREELVTNDDLTVEGLRKAYNTALQSLYRRAIEGNDAYEREKIASMHETFFLGQKDSSRSRSRKRGFMSMHDDYEDGTFESYAEYNNYPDDDHSQKRAHSDKTGKPNNAGVSAEDKTRKQTWLTQEYNELAALVQAQREQDTVWMDSSFAIHPGLLRELQSPKMSKRFKHSRGHSGLDFSMVMEGFIPLDDFLNYRGGRINIVDNSRAKLLLVPFDSSCPTWSEDLWHHQEKHSLRRGYKEKAQTKANLSFNDFSEHPNTLAFISALGEVAPDGNHFSRKDVILMLATSQRHEEQLLALMDKMDCPLTVLDLSSAQVFTRAPSGADMFGTAAGTKHVLGGPQIKKSSMEMFDAYHWDITKNEAVKTKMNELPDYWFAGSGDDYDFRHFTNVAQSWQKGVGDDTGAVFYIVPTEHPVVAASGDALSPAWRKLGNTLTAPENAPTSRLDWLLANSPLPPEHPLYNRSMTQYVKAYMLLDTVRDKHARGQDNHKSWRHEDELNPLPLAPFKIFDTIEVFNTAAADSSRDDAVYRRYPLLAQLNVDLFGKHSSGHKRSAALPASQGQAIAQYVTFVDTVHPDAPAPLLRTNKSPNLDTSFGL